ncbi:guanylate kinase [Chlamydiales bacterium]|nr:guanylate kinase [Chlamydiales bacterium]
MSNRLLPDFKKGKLFILSGPAGSGKTTLIDRLHREYPEVIKNISFTTRPKREDEKEGNDYFFITSDEFIQMKQDFMESISLFGNSYGTSRSWVEEKLSSGKHVFLVIDTDGARVVKKEMEAVTIFLHPPSIEVLESRLIHRDTEGKRELQKRLDRAVYEMDQAKFYDYQLINDELEIALTILRSIVIAELHRS